MLSHELAHNVNGDPTRSLLVRSAFATIRNRVTAVQNTEIDFFQELSDGVLRVPDREIERIRRIQRLADSRLDVTHPPTPFRIDMLNSHYVDQPLLDLKSYDMTQLDEELRPIKKDMSLKLNSGGQYYFLKLAKTKNQS